MSFLNKLPVLVLFLFVSSFTLYHGLAVEEVEFKEAAEAFERRTGFKLYEEADMLPIKREQILAVKMLEISSEGSEAEIVSEATFEQGKLIGTLYENRLKLNNIDHPIELVYLAQHKNSDRYGFIFVAGPNICFLHDRLTVIEDKEYRWRVLYIYSTERDIFNVYVY